MIFTIDFLINCPPGYMKKFSQNFFHASPEGVSLRDETNKITATKSRGHEVKWCFYKRNRWMGFNNLYYPITPNFRCYKAP
ncbi:MAG: hypothetical protein DWP95_06265 [Proteobacteria bacterium]|nr:MAG: hypothetical protein DWP95_06265 [Pseudomonadota bacterium]